METKTKIIPWWQPLIGKEEHKLIEQVLDDNFPNEGKLTTEFEKKICNLLGCKHAVTVTSGTIAIFLSLKAFGIGHGDEVIVPDITFIATANAVEMCGAKPVLVDVDPKTLNMEPVQFAKAITGKTRAVIPVHVSGRAAKINEIMEIAEKKDIKVVEDAAEAFMSKYKEKYLGTFAHTGCFSFSPNKTITTGQGGVIATNDYDTYARLQKLKDHGRPVRGTGGDDRHDTIGYNFKFTDLQAALGLGQLNYIVPRLERMKRNYRLYAEYLKPVSEVSLFYADIGSGEIPQWTDCLVEHRNELDKYLRQKNIDCRRFWLPVHAQIPYKLPDDKFPNSTKLSPKAIWLPSAFTLSDEDIKAVSSHIRNFFKK